MQPENISCNLGKSLRDQVGACRDVLSPSIWQKRENLWLYYAPVRSTRFFQTEANQFGSWFYGFMAWAFKFAEVHGISCFITWLGPSFLRPAYITVSLHRFTGWLPVAFGDIDYFLTRCQRRRLNHEMSSPDGRGRTSVAECWAGLRLKPA